MRNSDGDANSDGYIHSDGDCYSHAYANPDGNCNGAFANTDSDSNGDSNGNGYSNDDCDRTAAWFTDAAASADTAAARGQLLLW